jgi:ABC-type nitrate/sulfonate/bicarbonate transport system substrate-binding protein
VKVAIPDLVSPSYFPLIAAVELGFLEAKLDLIYPVTKTYEELREGRLDLVGGAAHAPLYAFKDWKGCKLLCALAQNMYWFLVVRKDRRAKSVADVKNLRIGAAPGPADGLKQMLKREGIEAQVGPVPGAVGEKASFGLMAAQALQEGKIDAFWANGMGAEIAVRNGVGNVVLDARREGSDEWKGYTFPALVSRADIAPEAARRAILAVHAAHDVLKKDPGRATGIGRKLFPPAEAELIAELIRRDLPYYDTAISQKAFAAMNRFSRELGLLSKTVSYGDVVWQS